VTEVYNAHRAEDMSKSGTPDFEQRNRAGLQETIVVKVHDLESLIRAGKCLSNNDQPVPNCQKQAIVLFLDGRQIKGIVPESGAPRLGAPSPGTVTDGVLQFHLQRNADSDEAWADILGAPPLSKGFFERLTEVSVGLENGYALPTDVTVAQSTDEQHRFRLIRIHIGWFIACSVVLFAVLFFLLALARYSELLRDIGPKPQPPTISDEGNAFQKWLRRLRAQKHKPFSLARFQMAIWFFLVIASFVFIWLITGATDTITGSTLVLIGIGAGTALGAAAIDVTAENATAASPPASPAESRGFFADILSERGSGVSFHRFQMFVWTLILAILFLYSVWSRLSMPEFSATLLALMGISSGTYLGFKIPEKQS
jgi:hypothetical protein